jgi:succinate dehydrogenase hydrophobic anchor subunit
MQTFKIQRYSAIALLFFLTLHMIYTHYVPPYHVSFNMVLTRLNSPVWKVIDFFFLVSVITHALAGSFQVVTDFENIYSYRKALAWAAIIIGILTILYGTKTLIAFQMPV